MQDETPDTKIKSFDVGTESTILNSGLLLGSVQFKMHVLFENVSNFLYIKYLM